MINNPLNIEGETVFICGPISREGTNYEAFADLQQKLDENQIKNINPHEMYLEEREKQVITEQEYINRTVGYIAMCDKVITLRGWDQTEVSQTWANIARILNKPMVVSEVFLKSLTPKAV